jgi:hypothetical protein
MADMARTTNDTYACGCCGQQMHGYSWSELSTQGWCNHTQNSVTFTMCGDCERKMAERRKARRAVTHA